MTNRWGSRHFIIWDATNVMTGRPLEQRVFNLMHKELMVLWDGAIEDDLYVLGDDPCSRGLVRRVMGKVGS
jgi:hypothetical protein